jgi:NAD(P)-dependent dehydrogenase (short-subunit alcohol dehydrogenase family)
VAGKTVLITGSSAGIGFEAAVALARLGARILLVGRDRGRTDAAVVALRDRAGVTAEAHLCDFSSQESIREFARTIQRDHARLDVLVNNAGGAPATDAATASPRFSEKIIALNLLAALHCAQRANTVMQAQPEGGVIISITSVSGLRPSPGTAAYGAAKAGLVSLTQSLAVEWAPKVRVVAVAAGMVRTELSHLHYGDEEGVRRVGATVPLGRMAEPEDVGDACAFLASPLASYVSGATLLLHGGGERPAFLSAVSEDERRS